MCAASGVEVASKCPTLETLAALVDNGLMEEERQEVEIHLVECRTCLDIVAFAMKMRLVEIDSIPPKSDLR